MDTLPEWLHHRYGPRYEAWNELSDGDQLYWQHEANAVRRAVARNGFKNKDNQTERTNA